MNEEINKENLKISVVMTVFNEAATIEKVLLTLAAQTHKPDEVVIVDGGSGDNTVACIRQFQQQNSHLLNLKLVVQPGTNISQGRNLAIRSASHATIAVTDAGVKLKADWLACLSTPFKIKGAQPVEVVAGFFRADPDPTSPWEIALGATTLPVETEIQPTKFLPSSRSVAFTKQAWYAAGGYPEWLDYCEDLIFDLNLKRCGYEFKWCPAALAYFRPRPTPLAFFRQYYHYARGDGKAELFLKRHLLRYLTYCIFAPLATWLCSRHPWLWPLLIGAGLAYVRTPYRRLFKNVTAFQQLPLTGQVQTILWVPVIRVIGDVAKMCGYPLGLKWRWKYAKTLASLTTNTFRSEQTAPTGP